MHMSVCVHISVCTHTRACTSMCVCAHRHTYKCVIVRANTYMSVCVCMSVCECACSRALLWLFADCAKTQGPQSGTVAYLCLELTAALPDGTRGAQNLRISCAHLFLGSVLSRGNSSTSECPQIQEVAFNWEWGGFKLEGGTDQRQVQQEWARALHSATFSQDYLRSTEKEAEIQEHQVTCPIVHLSGWGTRF